MISFYRKFVPNIADLCSPLSDLLKKGVKEPLNFSEQQQSCFAKLKRILSNSPVLRLPDLTKQFCVRTDASNIGIGCVLFQYWDNVPYPVHYLSRKLLKAETNYSSIERECLAIVWSIDKLKCYLYGRKFILDRLIKWTLSLQPYNFHIVYIKGSETTEPL